MLSSDEQIKRLICSQLALGGSLLMQSLSSFTTVSGTNCPEQTTIKQL